MSKQNSLKQLLRRINSFFSKIGWLYLILTSLFVLVLIQWYTSTTRPNTATQNAQFGRIQQLEHKVNQQSQLIESMQKEIDTLKKKN